MSAASDQALAGQLMALLDGETVRDAGDEALTLAGFARRLPWPVPRLSTTFRTGLRGKLVGWPARTRLPFAGFSLGAYVGMAAVIAVAVISGLVLLGPRISGVFGSAINSLDSPSVGYDRQYSSGSTAPGIKPTAVPVPQHGPAPSLAPVAQEPGAGALPDDAAPANAAPAGHLIIKNAQVVMLVEDTDTAITRLTAIAAQYGGYILNSQSWYEEGYKEATVVLSVPAEYFEQALNRVREVATRVEQEAASGEDVTDQYVDLESQLRNLEATAERLRAFLGMAATVTEALRVNDELAGIEGQVEQVKGRMNYLAGRAAYSTISVDLRPPRPTPTPTPAPTVTPTPAPTPTPTPVVWQPGKTAERATNVLGAIGRFVVEALIWVGLVVLPVVGVPVLLFLAIGWAVGKVGRKAGRE